MIENNPLIAALQNPALYDHPIKAFQLIETHVSWVILTGHYAYKIKKPVDFDFLNYSSLERRRHFCHEELRLNKQLAPEIYCDVVAIYGTAEQPQFTPGKDVIEYAVKMREFPQNSLFSALLMRNELTPPLIDELAKIIVGFHSRARIAGTENDLGTPQHVHAPVVQNFEQIRPLLTQAKDLQQLDILAAWANEQFKQLAPIFAERKRQGFIRECHGDIYLNNIIFWEGRPVIFDCIEFNEEFRWIDTMADLAFLAMDLEDNHQARLAHQLINTYMKYSGDYFGLKVLPYYQAYRAVVRAKIALFRLFTPDLAEQQKTDIFNTYRSYMNLAERYTMPLQKALMITHGCSGSGKSTLAKEVMLRFGAIYIASDVERKRSIGLDLSANTNTAVNAGYYGPEHTQRIYHHLASLAALIIEAGYPVIVDAACLKQVQRKLFQDIANERNIPFAILSCHASRDFLRNSIEQRAVLKNDLSEARVDVLEMQLESQEPLTQKELSRAVVLQTDQTIDIDNTLYTIKKLLHLQ